MTVPSLATTVSGLLVEAIRTAVPGAGAVDPQVRPSQHADLQANGVLGLARQLGRDPRSLAAEVAGAVDATGAVRRCEVAGPGFLNLTVHDHALLEQVRRLSCRGEVAPVAGKLLRPAGCLTPVAPNRAPAGAPSCTAAH